MEYISLSKEELLASINPDMCLTKGFLNRIYGYSITEPEFADQAIKALEQAGCAKAWTYYTEWVAEYETAYNSMIKPVAEWYRRECEKEWEKKQKGGEEQRKQKIIQDLHQKSDRELLSLLQTLN